MTHLRPCLIILALLLVTHASHASSTNYTELAAIKRLRQEKRYDEALNRAQKLADTASGDPEQFHYLQLAIDIAVESLRDFDKAAALAAAVHDPARRDFAHLQVLYRFDKFDQALAFATDKPIDQWPDECRGSAHHMLAELQQRRGNAARKAGAIYLAKGDRANAQATFRYALTIVPAGYAWRNESLMTLANMLIEDHRTAEAVGLYETLNFEKMDQGVWKSRLLEGYARALWAHGRKIRAIETFDRLLQSGISKEWKAKIEKELDKIAEEL